MHRIFDFPSSIPFAVNREELLQVPRCDLMMKAARLGNLSAEGLEKKFGPKNRAYIKSRSSLWRDLRAPEWSKPEELPIMNDWSFQHMQSPLSWAEWASHLWTNCRCISRCQVDALEFVVDPPKTAPDFRRRAYTKFKEQRETGRQ